VQENPSNFKPIVNSRQKNHFQTGEPLTLTQIQPLNINTHRLKVNTSSVCSASSRNRRSEDGQKISRHPRHETNLLDKKNTSFDATKSPSVIKSVAMN